MKARQKRRFIRFITLVVAAGLLIEAPALSDQPAQPFPAHINLPNGFPPEGIEVGRGTTFYAGSISTGSIFVGDLRTGAEITTFPGTSGSVATGIELDQHNRLFVAGGGTGQARVIDASTGALLKTYQLGTGSAFINDVAFAGGFAYFTDSSIQVMYRVPLNLGAAETIPLTGDIQYQSGFNSNGIVATPNGDTLITVQTNTGKLFTVDPSTGVTSEIAGVTVPTGDGLLLRGRTLYVVQGFMGKVSVVQLSPDLTSGTLTSEITKSDFDIPTTIDNFGSRLYVVNARFTTTPGPSTPYWVTQL